MFKHDTSGSLMETGSASISLTVTNDASYSGSGTFSASGAVTGGGTITESGHLHTGDSPVFEDSITGAGSVTPVNGTGSGSQTGSTYWFYSGSGTYTDPGAGSGVAFYTPNSASTTISASVTGTAWASGQVMGTIGGNWTDGQNGSASLTESGSAATTLTETNDASYSGSGSFTAWGAVSGGGTIRESGQQHTDASDLSTYDVNGTTGQWLLQGGSGSGSESGSTFWSYSGSGSYSDAAVVSGIPAFPSPISGTPVNSGIVHGIAYTSGADSTTSEDSWSASENARSDGPG